MYEAIKKHVNNENLNHNGTTLQRIRKGKYTKKRIDKEDKDPALKTRR